MGLTANAPRTIHELLSEWMDDVRDKKSVQELAFADDPIALSWASYHVWQKFPTRRWVNLNEVDAHQHDHEIAAVTRRYYRDRFTMQVLRGKPLTAFQTVLYGIVSGEQSIMSDQMGALMKIPYFYIEDVALDAMVTQTQSVDLPGGYAVTAHEQTITPLTYVFASRKNQESHQWWWTDPEGHAVQWSVNTANPLASVVRSLYERGQPVGVRASWHPARHRGSRQGSVYFRISNVELI